MFYVFLECVFDLFMTYVCLLDIYTDAVFASITNKEGLMHVFGLSFGSLVLLMIPKLYATIHALIIGFGCVKEENKRRKLVFRILTFNEFRIQAKNVEYVHHAK